ncbi:transposase [Streptomyces sp. 110]|uniref:Transposase n=1 Tax=Streptomyces endocoffeicus TaxID=2898945 RepID=A0ABS1Q7L1_9ACTN|nr:transposase [Streptomyces endocoffeicus]
MVGVIRRHELTDHEWELLAPLIPRAVRLHRRPRPPARRLHRTKKGQLRTDEPDDHALGRSRGGLTSKIHLACDGKGRPLAILITPGQRHDSVCAHPLLERIRVPCTGPGQAALPPRSRHRRQGIQLPRLPRLPAPPRHHAHHPGEDRPAAPPAGPRPPPPTKRRSVSRHCCSGQDPFEDGPAPGGGTAKSADGVQPRTPERGQDGVAGQWSTSAHAESAQWTPSSRAPSPVRLHLCEAASYHTR